MMRLASMPWLATVGVLITATLGFAVLIHSEGFWNVRGALLLLWLGYALSLVSNPSTPPVAKRFAPIAIVVLLLTYLVTPPQPFSIQADGHNFPSLTDWITLTGQLYAEGEETFRVTVAEDSIDEFGDFLLGVPSIRARSLKEFADKLSAVHPCVVPIMRQDHWLVLKIEGEIQVCEAPDGRSFTRCAVNDCRTSN